MSGHSVAVVSHSSAHRLHHVHALLGHEVRREVQIEQLLGLHVVQMAYAAKGADDPVHDDDVVAHEVQQSLHGDRAEAVRVLADHQRHHREAAVQISFLGQHEDAAVEGEQARDGLVGWESRQVVVLEDIGVQLGVFFQGLEQLGQQAEARVGVQQVQGDEVHGLVCVRGVGDVGDVQEEERGEAQEGGNQSHALQGSPRPIAQELVRNSEQANMEAEKDLFHGSRLPFNQSLAQQLLLRSAGMTPPWHSTGKNRKNAIKSLLSQWRNLDFDQNSLHFRYKDLLHCIYLQQLAPNA
eukprot:scaffold2708_cov158-Ochromonas_danica.AAC.44